MLLQEFQGCSYDDDDDDDGICDSAGVQRVHLRP